MVVQTTQTGTYRKVEGIDQFTEIHKDETPNVCRENHNELSLALQIAVRRKTF